MATIKILRGSTYYTATELRITGCTVRHINQDTDVATITLGTADVHAALAEGSIVEIYHDDRKFLRGIIQPTKELVNPQSKTRTIEVLGPFQYLKNRIWEQDEASYSTGTAKRTNKYQFENSTALAVMNVVRGEFLTYGQVTELVSGYCDFPTTTIEKIEGTGQSYAAVIRTVMSFVPFSYTQINYKDSANGAAPNISFLIASGIYANPYTYANATILREAVINRNSILDYVQLNYWREVRIVTNTWESSSEVRIINTTTDNTRREWVAQQTAGARTGLRWFCRDVILEGNVVVEAGIKTENTSSTLRYWRDGTSGGWRILGDIMQTQGYEMARVYSQADVVTAYAINSEAKYLVSAQVYSNSNRTTLATASELDGWYPCAYEVFGAHRIPSESYSGVFTSSGMEFKQFYFLTGWSPTSGGAATHTWSFPMNCMRKAGGGSPSGVTWTWKKTSSIEPNAEQPVSGSATSIYNAFRTAGYDGKIQIPIANWANHYVINVNGTKAPYQSITFDLLRETATIEFGAPTHLAPDDLLAKLRRTAV